MSDLGQQLKDARMQKGLSLEDVQEMTKIRKRYLEAIEQGDFKVLPGSFYVRAFIKTYAEAVGLDPEALLQNHSKDVPSAEPENVMEPVLTKRSARTSAAGAAGGSRSGGGRGEGSKGLSTALMWTFPILILLIVAIVYFNSTKDPEKASDPGTTATTQQPADGSTTKPADSETADPGTTGGGAQTPGTETPPADTGTDAPADGTEATPPADTGAAETDPAATGETGTETDPAQTEDPAAQNGTDETGTTGEEGAAANTTGSTIVTPAGQEGKTTVFNAQPAQGGTVKVTINASGMSWLEVRRGSSNGEKLYYQNTKEGESMSFDLDAQGLFIKSGYSPLTDIRIDGQPITDGKTTSRFKINLAN
ncbi:RodZ domain-containing protein [Saccharibacillus alkalitolerans]|uniref:Helix-turn-helix domain-containing protein n=1 Tax=Saccharibacillus alkalitolerans TaxID=2705290 RepID=A0ABX0F375_9BACL|nr:RodZ domain-containing protein [Saccharibacillus alkalitolerans]NGZ75443.1 helix-turn-helix domain-containing protein [Saccharibacillus alkalitolerans]